MGLTDIWAIPSDWQFEALDWNHKKLQAKQVDAVDSISNKTKTRYPLLPMIHPKNPIENPTLQWTVDMFQFTTHNKQRCHPWWSSNVSSSPVPKFQGTQVAAGRMKILQVLRRKLQGSIPELADGMLTLTWEKRSDGLRLGCSAIAKSTRNERHPLLSTMTNPKRHPWNLWHLGGIPHKPYQNMKHGSAIFSYATLESQDAHQDLETRETLKTIWQTDSNQVLSKKCSAYVFLASRNCTRPPLTKSPNVRLSSPLGKFTPSREVLEILTFLSKNVPPEDIQDTFRYEGAQIEFKAVFCRPVVSF